MNRKLSHLNTKKELNMVDVGEKEITHRHAIACTEVKFPKEVWELLQKRKWIGQKGSILEIAKIAGIQAAKQTAMLIPLCHVLPLSWVDIQMAIDQQKIIVHAQVKTEAKTGVEMEALTAASIAALTIYDMCKALSHQIIITNTRLILKAGGKSTDL
jgi:cyclic pyranopterin phosphate synthase